jgi:hypothetical protein
MNTAKRDKLRFRYSYRQRALDAALGLHTALVDSIM